MCPWAADNRHWPGDVSVVFNKLFGGEREPYLVLSENDGSTPVAVAPVKEAPAKPAAAKAAKPAAPAAEPAVAAVSSSASGLTTAELLAAERAAEAENAAPRSTTTFAAELLNPAAALPRRRRRPGNALGDFKQMAGGLMRSGRGAGAAEG